MVANYFSTLTDASQKAANSIYIRSVLYGKVKRWFL